MGLLSIAGLLAVASTAVPTGNAGLLAVQAQTHLSGAFQWTEGVLLTDVVPKSTVQEISVKVGTNTFKFTGIFASSNSARAGAAVRVLRSGSIPMRVPVSTGVLSVSGYTFSYQIPADKTTGAISTNVLIPYSYDSIPTISIHYPAFNLIGYSMVSGGLVRLATNPIRYEFEIPTAAKRKTEGILVKTSGRYSQAVLQTDSNAAEGLGFFSTGEGTTLRLAPTSWGTVGRNITSFELNL